MIGRHFFHSTAFLKKVQLNVSSYALLIFLSISTKLGSCGDTHSFPVTDVLRYSQLKLQLTTTFICQMFLISVTVAQTRRLSIHHRVVMFRLTFMAIKVVVGAIFKTRGLCLNTHNFVTISNINLILSRYVDLPFPCILV